jgi:hypothetical protein
MIIKIFAYSKKEWDKIVVAESEIKLNDKYFILIYSLTNFFTINEYEDNYSKINNFDD